MDTTEHIKVTRLRDAAVAGLMLDGVERDHQTTCDACQDLFDIFKHELPATKQPNPTVGSKRMVV